MERGGGADPLILQRRAEIKDAYDRLLVEHPALPPEIRDIQVQLETCSLVFNCSQADVTAAVLSQDSHHILSSVPTGWGKTLPMLLAALLMPPGDTIPYFFDDSLDHFTPGSTTSILVPLTTIALQLKAECDKLGISALLSSEVLKMHVSPSRPLVVENFQETVISSGWPWPWRFGERAAAETDYLDHVGGVLGI